MCELMNWCEGMHILDKMERAQQRIDKSCDAVVRKDTFPIEMRCAAVCLYQKKILQGIANGIVAICERR